MSRVNQLSRCDGGGRRPAHPGWPIARSEATGRLRDATPKGLEQMALKNKNSSTRPTTCKLKLRQPTRRTSGGEQREEEGWRPAVA